MDINNGKIIFNGKEYCPKDVDLPCIDNNSKSVALLMKRLPKLIYTICDCFERKITFIPIDPTYPKDRIQYVIDNSMPDEIISDIDDVDFTPINSTSTELKDISYILYTSGSTGNPKGVEISRCALFNFFEGISDVIDFLPGKRIACLTTVSFDIFFLESLMAIYKGLTVVLANEDEQRNPRLMAKFISDNDIDMIQMTPSRMQLLLNHDKELDCLKSVKEIMIGGEPFPFSLLQILQKHTTAKIYNMYGPTETTIWSTVSDLTNKHYVDIGRPIKNTEIYIVDENLYLLPNGQVGEICIAGKGLAKGYVGRADLTAEKFVNLPQNPETRIYRTGDVGRYLDNGDLEHLGRIDNQVKIRGHRIELEEIEAHLNQFLGINQNVVVAVETNETEKTLHAFYTSENNIDTKDISNYLSTKLPDYMIPAVFKRIKEFIQTANGKIDRKRVLECVEIESINYDTQTHIENKELTGIQRRILSAIIESLKEKITDNIPLDTEFNSIGLNSIFFIKTVVTLETEFDFEFDDEKLLITEFPTVMSMIEYVESKVQC